MVTIGEQEFLIMRCSDATAIEKYKRDVPAPPRIVKGATTSSTIQLEVQFQTTTSDEPGLMDDAGITRCIDSVPT